MHKGRRTALSDSSSPTALAPRLASTATSYPRCRHHPPAQFSPVAQEPGVTCSKHAEIIGVFCETHPAARHQNVLALHIQAPIQQVQQRWGGLGCVEALQSA